MADIRQSPKVITMDIRQSEIYSRYMKNLGWRVDKVGSDFVYLRHFPFLGYLAKVPRFNLSEDISDLISFKKSRKIFRLKISPLLDIKNNKYPVFLKKLIDTGFKIDQSPFNPTTNYLLDLTSKENAIFNNFLEAKRRGVRRAIKNEIYGKESSDIHSFINIRKKQYPFVGFLVKQETERIWNNFYPGNASLLLAYKEKKPIAGILMLFFDKIAYYWQASALQKGKKLFAPTLLVWEALKLAKRKGCTKFDFEGIYDERFPRASSSWKGFTKFKEGFGGKKVVYMENLYL